MPQAAAELKLHGGNIGVAAALFPQAPVPWLDLSTGINPLAYPVGPIAPESWSRLPEPAALAGLEKAARLAYRASPQAEIVAAPGTQAILQWLPQLISARHVGIMGPTYGEHEKTWRACGAKITIADAFAGLEDCDVIVAVNPNNPDGRLLPATVLASVADRLAAKGGLLIVDEAFMDFAGPDFSLAPALAGKAAIVLRSFGKTYGLAGIRLGFAIAAPELAAKLRIALGPWAVCGPAIEIGRRALADTQWLQAAQTRLAADADRLDAMLLAAGFDILGGTCLFRLSQSASAAAWFMRLCEAGILVRPFEGFPQRLRFGIPYHPQDWARLEAALR